MKRDEAYNTISKALEQKGFEVMDSSFPDKAPFVSLFRKDNIDVIIEIVKHTDNL